METRIFLTIAILAFNFSISLADNANELFLNRPVSEAQIDLAPAVPDVADFSDLVPESAPSAVSLIPDTPKEAGFEDESADENDDNFLNILSPTAPKEADFEDDITPEDNTLSWIPTTPDEAGFEESV